MLKRWFYRFMKDFANFKRAILLASVKKGLTALECCRNHPFGCITPKADEGIDVAFDSERRVLRCDNGVCRMAVTKLNVLGISTQIPFLLGCKVHSCTRINSCGFSLVSRWAWFECFWMKKASFRHQLNLYSNGHFNDAATKKSKEQFEPRLLHWVSLELNSPLQQFLKSF